MNPNIDIKTGVKSTSVYDNDKDPMIKLYRSNSTNYVFLSFTLNDIIKSCFIVILIAASYFLLSYQPHSFAFDHGFQVSGGNSSVNKLKIQNYENPYGFQPFYKVHGRVEYKNPSLNLCDGINPKRTLLLTILSRASNVHIREAIRQTWGAIQILNGIEIRLMFIVGVDDGMIKQVEIEQNIYHDLIQVNLPENYPVVCYKELAALCWSKHFCPEVRFQFKADEDIHLNTPLLTRIVADLLKNESLDKTPIMYGWFRHKSRVDRTGRYLITEEEYPGYYYPPYTFGIGYLMTRAGRDQLCDSAVRPHPVTRVGDAYITGILRDHALVDYARLGDVHYIYSYTLGGEKCTEYFSTDPKLVVCMSSLHSGINEVADEYVRVWNVIQREHERRTETQTA